MELTMNRESVLNNATEMILPDILEVIKSFQGKKEAISARITELSQEKEKRKTNMIVWFVVAIGIAIVALAAGLPALLLLSLGAVIMALVLMSKNSKADIQMESLMNESNDLIFDVSGLSIKSIGVNTMKFAKYPFEDGSLLVDEENIATNKRFVYKEMDQIESLYEGYNNLVEHLKELPCIHPLDTGVETSYYQEDSDSIEVELFEGETKINDLIAEISAPFMSTKDTTVELGLIEPSDSKFGCLNDESHLIVNESYKDFENDLEIKRLQGKVSEVHLSGDDIDDFAMQILRELRGLNKDLNHIRSGSLDMLSNEQTFYLTNAMVGVGHNFYCPKCNKDVLDDVTNRNYNLLNGDDYDPVSFMSESKMHLVNWTENIWECPLCKYQTDTPLIMNKMYDEVFMPSSNLLFAENYQERIKLYGDLRMKYITFINDYEKQVAEISRKNRDAIYAVKVKMQELEASVNRKYVLIDKLKDYMEAADIIHMNEMNSIIRNAQRIISKIEEKNIETNRIVDQNIQKIKDKVTQENMAEAGYERVDQQKRDQVFQTIADNTAKAVEVGQQQLDVNRQTLNAQKEGNNIAQKNVDAVNANTNATKDFHRDNNKWNHKINRTQLGQMAQQKMYH